MTPEKSEIVDKLILELFSLIEEQVQCKVNIERKTYEGQLFIAKARYTQGSQTISTSQLPTENSTEFSSLSKVYKDSEENSISPESFKLQTTKVDKDSGFIDPMKWFGVLVPRALQQAKESFQTSLELVVESANIQKQLQTVLGYICELKIKN